MEFIDLKKQQKKIRSNLIKSIDKILDEGDYILGSEVTKLEKKLSSFCSVDYCLTVSTGTDALLMSLMALDLKPGDEVITTPFTWISTVEVIKFLGAVPVYCDIESDTFNIDPDTITENLSSKTKAIIPVSLFGQCADFDEINKIAHEEGIPVIEDGAQSFGANYKNKKSCSLSTIGCTSFFPSKPLGCYGDGGACFTNDEEIYEKLKAIRVHGATSKNNFDFVGLNGRFDTIQAAILLVKLNEFDKEIELRQEKANFYENLIKKHLEEDGEENGIIFPLIKSYNKSVFAQYTIKAKNRELILQRLKEKKIPFAIHYEKLAYEHNAYRIKNNISLPVAESVKKQVFSIPMHPYLEEADQVRVINAIFGKS